MELLYLYQNAVIFILTESIQQIFVEKTVNNDLRILTFQYSIAIRRL